MIVILDCEYITIIWFVGREASLPCMRYTCTWKGITRQMMIIRDELETMRMGSQNKGKSRFMCNTRMQWRMPNVKVFSELGSKAAHLCVYLRWWSLASRLSSVLASSLCLSLFISEASLHFRLCVSSLSTSLSHIECPTNQPFCHANVQKEIVSRGWIWIYGICTYTVHMYNGTTK